MNVRLQTAIGALVAVVILTACGSASNQQPDPSDLDPSSTTNATPVNESTEAEELSDSKQDDESTDHQAADKPDASVEDVYPTKPRAESVPREPLQLTDEGSASADFVAFRNTLRQAVQDRDSTFIRAIAAPDIRLTFGLPITIEELDLDNPNAPFWKHMEKALATGCASEIFGIEPERETWVCPHVFLAPGEVSAIDPYEDIVIVGENINVRIAPTADSPVIDTVSNEVVRHDYDSINDLTETQQQAMSTIEGWHPIITSSGQRGFVSSQYAYSPIGHRAFFTKEGDAWQMNVFIAGD